MEDRPDIQLSAAEHQRIFETDGVPYLLGSAEPLVRSAHPVMVIVGGQPGGGKSRSMDSVRLDLEGQGGVMEIVADELRKFHPQYAALMREDDRLAADLTHADASCWADKAESFARGQRLNVLLEATLKTPENVVRKLAAYRERPVTSSRSVSSQCMSATAGKMSCVVMNSRRPMQALAG